MAGAVLMSRLEDDYGSPVEQRGLGSADPVCRALALCCPDQSPTWRLSGQRRLAVNPVQAARKRLGWFS